MSIESNRSKLPWVIAIGIIILLAAGIGFLWRGSWFTTIEAAETADGTNLKFRTRGEQIEIYRDQAWHPVFWQGVNMGAALPGHYPGEFAIDKNTYLRWFHEMAEMGSNVVRVYTIHPPHFYEALVEYNKQRPEHPLYLIQGVYTLEEELIALQDAYEPSVREHFRQEIRDAVGAVYGKVTIESKRGHASGEYKVNAGPYVAAWHIGTEWDPQMVVNTNELHHDMKPYEGKHFRAKEGASPFESWLAEMLDVAAEAERSYGWEHPITFTNWVTTDPLTHPGEPTLEEDMVSVDAMMIEPVEWAAGYFASYHVYPYYPDLFRFDETLRNAVNEEGEPDSYKSYLRELKQHHAGIPIIVAEFGVPSSLGIGHLGPLGRDQGGHGEAEQGEVNASLFRQIVDEDYAGAVLFSWQDEWFKRSWNTMRYEIPADRRAFWYNVLSVEQSFGLIGMYPSKDEVITIDGRKNDWDKLSAEDKQRMDIGQDSIKEMRVVHDEAYVYMLLELEDDFDPSQNALHIGVDTLPGGNRHAPQWGDATLDEGLEMLIVLDNAEEGEVRVSSAYDVHKRLYGYKYGMLNVPEDAKNEERFDPWKLSVGLEMTPPDTKIAHPFEEVNIGKLARGYSDPEHPEYDSLASWQSNGNLVEIRIPWMLLGFSDPSSHQVISYQDTEPDDLTFISETSKGIRFNPWISPTKEQEAGQHDEAGPHPRMEELPIYQWDAWEQVEYVERKKESYHIMKAAFIENLK